MMWVFQNASTRTTLLNALLAVVLVAAVIADKWPALTGVTIALAFSAVVGMVFWLYQSAKRTRSASSDVSLGRKLAIMECISSRSPRPAEWNEIN